MSFAQIGTMPLQNYSSVNNSCTNLRITRVKEFKETNPQRCYFIDIFDDDVYIPSRLRSAINIGCYCIVGNSDYIFNDDGGTRFSRIDAVFVGDYETTYAHLHTDRAIERDAPKCINALVKKNIKTPVNPKPTNIGQDKINLCCTDKFAHKLLQRALTNCNLNIHLVDEHPLTSYYNYWRLLQLGSTEEVINEAKKKLDVFERDFPYFICLQFFYEKHNSELFKRYAPHSFNGQYFRTEEIHTISKTVYSIREFEKFNAEGDYYDVLTRFGGNDISVDTVSKFYDELNKKCKQDTFVAQLCHWYDYDESAVNIVKSFYPLMKRQLDMLNKYFKSIGENMISVVIPPYDNTAEEEFDARNSNDEDLSINYQDPAEEAGRDEERSMDEETDGFWRIQNDFD